MTARSKMREAASVFCPFAPVENFNPAGRHRLLSSNGSDTRRLTLSKSYCSDVCYYSYGYGARAAGLNRVDRAVCAAARARHSGPSAPKFRPRQAPETLSPDRRLHVQGGGKFALGPRS